jgi:hypothetical protein
MALCDSGERRIRPVISRSGIEGSEADHADEGAGGSQSSALIRPAIE